MKILTIVYSLEIGGVQRAAQNFAQAYKSMGHDSRTLVTGQIGIRGLQLREQDVHVWQGIDTGTLGEVGNWNPDIVHLHAHGLSPKDVERILACAPVAKVLETNVFSNPSPWEDRLSASCQLSSWCAWKYRRHTNRPAIVRIVPNPVRVSSFGRFDAEKTTAFRKQLGFSRDDVVIGRIGQPIDGKWSPHLIDVYDRLKVRHPGLGLLLVGASEATLRAVQRSRHRSTIAIIERLENDDELRLAFSAMDVFALIAKQGESFGYVLAESLLCETPAVVLNTPWADNSQAEVIGNSIGGFSANSMAGFIDALDTLIRDEGLRRCLGRCGRDRIIQNYKAEKVAETAIAATLSGFAEPDYDAVPDELLGSFDGLGPVARWLLKRRQFGSLYKAAVGYKPLRLKGGRW